MADYFVSWGVFFWPVLLGFIALAAVTYWSAVWGRGDLRGNRGERRPDDVIAEDINDRLLFHGALDASQMRIEVHQGIAVIHGVAKSARERRLAEWLAASTPGVVDVANNLEVKSEADQPKAA